jgi:hypothetical protein
MSVLGRLHGSAPPGPSSGFEGKTFQRARYGEGGSVSSAITRPVYVRGSLHTTLPLSSKSHTRTT